MRHALNTFCNPKKRVFRYGLLAGAIAVSLAGCGSDSNSNPQEQASYTLQLLHVADMDGSGSAALANVENFSAIVQSLRAEYPDNTLFLSSGDNYIPGPRFSAAADSSVDPSGALLPVPGVGRGDISLLNALGLQASAVGNHDLDTGTASFDTIISPQTTSSGASYAGATFPYLSTNLNFSTDANLADNVAANLQDLSSLAAGSLSGYGTFSVDGELIGVIAATTPTLGSITSVGDITINPASQDIDALAATIQPGVDALVASGVNKVILLAHMQQIDVEKQLAGKLSGVDIIVAGGSNTLLADANDTLQDGDTAADTYPLEFTSASGEPVLLVNVDGDYQYVGRLVVGFDAQGKVLTNTLDDRINGAYAAVDSVVSRLSATPIAMVSQIKQALNNVLARIEGTILGNTAVFLEGRREKVRTEETNLGNLTAEANLWLARKYDPSTQVSIKNGGGIRDLIGSAFVPPGATTGELTLEPPAANPAIGKQAGDISQLAIQGSLRFNNGLVITTVTAQELVRLLEHGVSSVENTAGRFPQVAGLKFSFDPARPARMADGATQTQAGSRLRSLVLVDASGNTTDTILANGTLQGNPSRSIRLATLGFLATNNSGVGGDGYPFSFPLTNFVDLQQQPITGPNAATFADPGTEQDAFSEYLLATFPDPARAFAQAETSIENDTRIQNLSVRSDTINTGTGTVIAIP